jgi:hypothetical protein
MSKEAIGSRVDDDEVDALGIGGLNAIDQTAFVVALKSLELNRSRACAIFQRDMNVRE